LFGFSAQTIGVVVLFGGAMIGSFLLLAFVMWKAADIFYNVKLAQPLDQLNKGVEQIRHQNLDFALHNDHHDELGELTRSFESMRQALQDALQQSWQLLEEQKEVNAAFAHDLRTPLTVLQGDAEMLMLNPDPANIQDLAQDIQHQFQRVTDFIGLMSQITSLQAAPDESQTCTSEQLTKLLREEVAHMPVAVTLSDQRGESTPFKLATSAMLEVLDNQLSNARRFAKSTVTLTVVLTPHDLQMTVLNDGPQLTKIELENVRTPFFSQQKAGQHLGVGMYICKVLCQTHGGDFTVHNVPEGVATRARFQIT
jgi:signal transduction histidine kinase